MIQSSNLPANFNITFNNWHTDIKKFFLRKVEELYGQMKKFNIYELLRDNLKLHSGYNMDVEILWFKIGFLDNKTDIVPFVEDFLSKTGRMNYLVAIYRAYGLYNLQNAKASFQKNK